MLIVGNISTIYDHTDDEHQYDHNKEGLPKAANIDFQLFRFITTFKACVTRLLNGLGYRASATLCGPRHTTGRSW